MEESDEQLLTIRDKSFCTQLCRHVTFVFRADLRSCKQPDVIVRFQIQYSGAYLVGLKRKC